ncbi:MAG: hypothetical protein IKT52_09745 [Oscillospiraceae bacterium]|nr:hypothetical protein [Oscillospiraceae bacterium]
MYTAMDRNILLESIVQFMRDADEFEGLLHIGSGSVGYTDIYSDIDLMAGCPNATDIPSAHKKLSVFFRTLEPVYVDQRKWSETVLGLSVYFENGLSVDISYMPTNELKIRSPYWKVLFSKNTGFSNMLECCGYANPVTIDDSVHHRFIFALRRCEIALCRSEYVYADMALTEARQILLTVEAAREGKKLHQFKAFNTLDIAFLNRLEQTYPTSRNCAGISNAKKHILELYLDIVAHCDFLTFDGVQLKLLNCFE